jgi:predicted DCC family thiol-disulfide oxidoreductase YuxK
LYDGDCGICTAVAARMQRAHGAGVAEWRCWHAEASLPEGVSAESLGRSIALVRGDGGIERGFVAFRHLFLRTPGLRLLGACCHLPGVSLLGRVVYALVARYRVRISRMIGLDACVVRARASNNPPPRTNHP